MQRFMSSTLIDQIDAFVDLHGMSPITFGRKALGDPHFVKELREGRDIRVSTLDRVQNFMLTYGEESAASARNDADATPRSAAA